MHMDSLYRRQSALFTGPTTTLFIKILKMGPTALFTHLKIIFLQRFRFSVFSKISCIWIDRTYYVFTLGGAAVSWKFSKQTCIARSTMESEFIALDKAREEAKWLRHFLEDMPMWMKLVPPNCIHCDSKSAIGRAQSHMYNSKSWHICWRHNTVRQLLSNGIISIDFIKSKENIVDPLTKTLSKEHVNCSSRGNGVKAYYLEFPWR